MTGALGLFLPWEVVPAQPTASWTTVLVVLVATSLWGMLVYRVVDDILQSDKPHSGGATTRITCLVLIGNLIDAWVGIPSFGVFGGLILAGVLPPVIGLLYLGERLLVTGVGGE